MSEVKDIEKTENTQPTSENTIPRTDTRPAIKKALPIGALIGIGVALVVAIIIGAFVAGMQLRKGINAHSNNAVGQNRRFGNRGGRGPGRNFNGAFGQVTAVSDSAITIATRQRFNPSNSSNTSTTKTFTINSSTTITVNGNTAKASDIKTGDRVVIQPSSSDATVAGTIRDGFGGPAAPNNPSGGQQSSDSAQPIVTQ